MVTLFVAAPVRQLQAHQSQTCCASRQVLGWRTGLVLMRAGPPGDSTLPPSNPPTSSFPRKHQPHPKHYVSGELGVAAQLAALEHVGGDACVLATICADGVVDALTQTFTKADSGRVFVVCGAGFNGLVGVQLALALSKLGYKATAYLPRELEGDLILGSAAKLSEAGISVCDFTTTLLSTLC
jgi:hypothetical protein